MEQEPLQHPDLEHHLSVHVSQSLLAWGTYQALVRQEGVLWPQEGLGTPWAPNEQA